MKHYKILLMAVMLIWGITANGQYNPSNPAEPGAPTEKRTLNLLSYPENSCTFNISRSTSQDLGSTVNIRAYANTGFKFLRWEENGKEVSTSSSLNITMSKNRALTAVFEYNPGSPSEPSEPQEYAAVYVGTSPSGAGTINISTGNKYVVGSSVNLSTTNKTYYTFLNWTQDGEVISTSKSFNYVVKTVNAPIIANYRYDYVYNPSNPGEPNKPVIQNTLNLECNPKGAGYFNVSSGNKYTPGSDIKLIAYSNKNYVFKNWTKDGEIISEDYSFYYKMPEANSKLVANFDYVYVYSPDSPSEPNSPNKYLSIYGLTETVFPGQSFNYPIYLQNNQDIIGMIIDIRFSPDFTPDLDAIILSGRGNGHEISYEEVGDGYIRFKIDGEAPFSDVNGKIFEIPVTANNNVAGNQSYPVNLIHGVVILSDRFQLPVEAREGSISVSYAPEGAIFSRYSYDKFQNRVKFTNQSAKEATHYEWDFGDGTTSTEENPMHVYDSSGTYKVSLTAYDEMSSARFEQDVLINVESSWVSSGNFTLGYGDGGVRCFSSLADLIKTLGNSRINGDVIINVESGNSFGIELSTSDLGNLWAIYSALYSGNYLMKFQKSGNNSNPVISYGYSAPVQFDKNVIDLISNLGKFQKYSGIEVKMWGFSFNPSEVDNIPRQDVCSGTRTEPVDFSSISTDLQFTWNASGYYEQTLAGYEKTGTRTIPSMNIINEGNGDANIIYEVKATYGGKDFISFPVYITVHPALVGLFSVLEPKDGTQFEITNISLSWNNISNASYDVYLWNAAEDRPEEPTIADTSNIKASVSKFCKNGNRYLWQVRAHNYCQEIYSDTLSFNIGSLPNLHVSRLDVGEAVAGKEMTVSWTVTNDGNGSTNDTQWEDNIWLVPDVYLGTGTSAQNNKVLAKLLKTIPNIKSLDSGESYNNSVKIQLEERIYGKYYIIVSSDMHDVKNIKWQTVNNTVPEPYTPSVTGNPYPYLFAETTSSYNKVSEANETSTQSDNFNYAKIEIAVPGLVDLTVSDVIAVVDNTPGTVSTTIGTIRIEPTPHTIYGIAESKEFYSGKYLKVTAKIKNSGALKMNWTKFNNILYISHSPTNENPDNLIAIASKNITVFLDPGSTTEVSFDCQIPYDWYGETYFYVFADSNDDVYELAAKNNNWGKSEKYDFKLTPGADFIPYDLKLPTSIACQTPFDISYKVKNVGPNVPTYPLWTDLVYLSKKSEFDDSAVEIGRQIQGGVYMYDRIGSEGNMLVPAKKYHYEGDNYAVRTSLMVDDITEGNYYIYVKVDAYNSVLEKDGEDNNIIRSGLITCTKPDLQIELLSVDCDTIVAGKTVAVSWRLKNTGNGLIKNLKTTDSFYASKNQDGASALKLATISNEIFINPDDEQILRANILIPENCELDGVHYIFMRTNVDNKLLESNYNNNSSNIIKTWFKPIPKKEDDLPPTIIKETNIGIANISAPSFGLPGETITIRYSLTNSGSKRVTTEVPQEVFISSNSKFDSSAIPCKIFSQDGTSIDLGAEDSTSIVLTAEIPSTLKGGNKYLHLVVDRQNTLKESYTNNNFGSWAFRLNGNLPTIEIRELSMPDSIMTSTDTTASWVVKNTGQWKADAFTIGVYRASSAQWNSKDTRLASLNVKSLEPGDSIMQSANISMPDNNHGKWNIIVKSDEYSTFASQPITVELSPVPDLYVKSLTTDGSAWSGQKITLKATFSNIGANRTRQNMWTEDYYLAQSNILNTATAIKLVSRVHNGVLEAGAEYTSNLTVTIPPNIEGNYMIFAVIDGGDAIYESDENNNIRSIPLFINGKYSSASDLTISNISAPSHINAGENFTLSYRINNQGEYKATGMCREVIYLSTDNVFDVDDLMVGTVSGDINIAPGGYVQRTATGRISNITEGNYYLIIKTNSTRSIAETETENNFAVLATKVRIEFPSISLNGSTSFITSGYFKLTIPEGFENKTIGFYLGQSVENNGGLYVAYENVPTSASYDDCSTRQCVTEQEVIIPNVKHGNYYILAQDNSSVVSKDNYAFSLGNSDNIKQVPLTISTKELYFGASSLSVRQGGNAGWLSTNIKGALLDSIMDFRLVKNNIAIPAEILHFKNSTSSVVTFNLNGAEVGNYDVISELPNGVSSYLRNGFSVIPGTSLGLEVKLDTPEGLRPGAVTPMSFIIFNNGTNDVEISEFIVELDHGLLGLSCEELLRNTQNRLTIRPDFEKNRNGYISIPPGTKHVFNFFMKSEVRGVNNLSLYLVK